MGLVNSLVLIVLVYPMNAWRDAPLFPTPLDALRTLALHAPLADGARVLDAGCGLGHGLRALRAVYPNVRLAGTGVELAFTCIDRPYVSMGDDTARRYVER